MKRIRDKPLGARLEGVDVIEYDEDQDENTDKWEDLDGGVPLPSNHPDYKIGKDSIG